MRQLKFFITLIFLLPSLLQACGEGEKPTLMVEKLEQDRKESFVAIYFPNEFNNTQFQSSSILIANTSISLKEKESNFIGSIPLKVTEITEKYSLLYNKYGSSWFADFLVGRQYQDQIKLILNYKPILEKEGATTLCVIQHTYSFNEIIGAHSQVMKSE